MSTSRHVPVLLDEIIAALNVQPGGRYIDCTLGGGGHAAAILKHSSPGGQLLGIDADPQAIEVAKARLVKYRDSALLVNENFANLQAASIKYDFFPVHGILLDLGISSLQLSARGRGFSFQNDSPLDMRFSPEQKVRAADIVNSYTAEELTYLIKTYGEEGFSQRIAQRIVEERPIKSSLRLAEVIEKAVGGRRRKIHPATRTFQALRIAVNQELEHLETALKQAVDLLGFEGRLVVISYHSLEDRIVKQFIQREAKQCLCPPEVPICVCGHKASLRLVSRRVITPSLAEVERNPRSRSARLRVAERVYNPSGSFTTADEPSFFIETKSTGWRRPAMVQRLRMVFSMS
ncbi:16S rRNA (cytosine(1402)-N(4))-methyltransferase RsmH [Chloroflexota bacterium]